MVNLELARHIVDYLNELVALDIAAVEELIFFSTCCNKKLSAHPTCQVRTIGKDSDLVTVLGLLNGICGVYTEGRRAGSGAIAAEVKSADTDELICFSILLNEDEPPLEELTSVQVASSDTAIRT